MANVNSISNSNSYSSSIYGTKNVLSGLATGMDTETMIENSISGYKTKLNQLKQQQEKITWKQDAYRDVTDNLVSLNNKYTSYTSKTNLYSVSFFDKSVTEATGTNADKVSASGKPNSAITVNAVTKLATSAKYNVSANAANSAFTAAIGLSGANQVNLSSLAATKDNNSNTIDFTLDGTTKSVKVSDLNVSDTDSLISSLNTKLSDAFGTGKVTAALNNGKLSFQTDGNSNSTLSVSSNEEALGLGKKLTNFLDTSKSLKEIFGTTGRTQLNGNGKVTEGTGDNAGKFYDEDGNLVDQYGKRINADGTAIYDFGELTVNGVSVGSFNSTDSLGKILNSITTSEAGVTASYSQLTNEFSFASKETGAGSKIEFGGDLKNLFGTVDKSNANSYTAGTDAELSVNVNGQNMNLKRSSNTFDIDGLSITLKDTFNDGKDVTIPEQGRGEAMKDGVTFVSKTDADSIIDGLKSFIDDFNAALKQVHDAYSTSPNKDSKGNTYNPLTDDDKANMSETAIKNYEEKAKTGLLYQDSDLSNLYTRLVNAVSTGNNGAALREVGIETSFDSTSKITSLQITDEAKLRNALESNPDKVSGIFNKTGTGKSGTGGLMENMKNTLDAYASTSVVTPGILVNKAGTKLSSVSLLNNTLQKSYNSLSTSISNMEDKISDKIDYYTKQFTSLEQLMSNMNNQSSMLSGLMGY